MEVQALTRHARMSPKKVREVTRVIQGRRASEALELIRYIPRKSARLVAKTLKSAVANAENNNELSVENLFVKFALVEQGPVLKRFKAAARGSAAPRRKRTSHIRIVLSDGAATAKSA
jgi:large subunit ribosomal protein L22